jgi:iron complex transport system ATP-binding protein
MIRIDNAGHWFRAEQWLFRRLSLALAPSEITAILGPNGTGKTTLLRAICGTLALQEGSVRAEGHVGYVPQALQADHAYSAFDMVLLGRSRYLGRFNSPGRGDLARARESLHEVGLSGMADRRYDHLSGGQRQLVLLARALASDCRVLVLDEPASALDFANQGIVLRLIRRLARTRELAVLFTTHHPDHALGIADHTLLMQRDASHLYGAAATVLTEEHLGRMYGVAVRRVEIRAGGEIAAAIVPLHGLHGAAPDAPAPSA